VREFESELDDLTEAIKAAVQYCKNHDILKEFLELHASEVLSMIFTGLDIDTLKELQAGL